MRKILSISPRKNTNHLGGTQYQIAIKIKILSSHCCCTAMVALDTTNSDNAVSALRSGICHQKLELPDLVTAQLHAWQVVSLQFPQNFHVRIQMPLTTHHEAYYLLFLTYIAMEIEQDGGSFVAPWSILPCLPANWADSTCESVLGTVLIRI